VQHWVYGTVFNNVQTIEKSISSIYSPDLNIVIVDAYSTDGTYEKLLTLKNEFNLRLFRAKCSRGKGRDIALRKCPLNSFAAYIDFDAVYNNNFKKILEAECDMTLAWQYHSQTSFFSRVDTAVKAGGFRDLSSLETLEFILRCGISNTLPVQVGRNMQYEPYGFGGRERRYASGKDIFPRVARVSIDSIRSQGITYAEFLKYYDYYKIPLYWAARIKGTFRVSRGKSNALLFMERIIETLSDHKKFGIENDWIALPVPFPLLPENETSEKTICKIWGGFRKFVWTGSGSKWGFPVLRDRKFVVYTLTERGLENYIQADPFKKNSKQEFQEINVKPCSRS
jgi:glycosyltransferase involved in cell wall biosynthesis